MLLSYVVVIYLKDHVVHGIKSLHTAFKIKQMCVHSDIE